MTNHHGTTQPGLAWKARRQAKLLKRYHKMLDTQRRRWAREMWMELKVFASEYVPPPEPIVTRLTPSSLEMQRLTRVEELRRIAEGVV